MPYYFSLQYRMLNRYLQDVGLPPVIGYLLALAVFTGLSVYLFLKTGLAVYLYSFIALGLVLQLSDTRRNDFLKTCFDGWNYRLIRFSENALLALPFALFLTIQGAWVAALVVLPAAMALSLFHFEQAFQFTLPTPFYKRPFEFLVGFRQTFLLLILIAVLLGIAVWVGNFNLGIFALALIFLVSLSYCGNPESMFYVWVHALGARAFLQRKILTGFWHVTILSLPFALVLGAFFPGNWYIILLVQGLGYLYLALIILGKYATYPQPIGIPQGILIGLGMWFPPLLLGILPFFYQQSVRRLIDVLEVE